MKEFLLWLILAQTGDLVTSKVAMDRGCVENSPILRHMNFPSITAIKGGVAVGMTLHFGRKPKPTNTDKFIVGSFAVSGTVGTIWNLIQIPKCRKP